MFEDDLDIDEILSNSEASNSFKRGNTGFQDENLSKKPRLNQTAFSEDVAEPSKQAPVKKLFRFKKKATVPNEVITDDAKLNVHNTIASPTTESNRKETDCKSTQESSNLLRSEEHRKNTFSRLTSDCDKITRSDSDTLNFSSRKVNQHIEEDSVSRLVEEHSVSRIQRDKNAFKRRFPGPAGLLPERRLGNSFSENFSNFSRAETKDELCTQDSFVHFNEEAWEQMVVDFKTQVMSLPEKYNIQWIKSRTTAKRLVNQKAPFLAAFVDTIRSHSIQNPIVHVVLKDKTGTIQGTILHNLYEEHSNNLTVGSVVVLREIGVLNMGPNDEPYLTITRNNLVSIYSNKKIMVDGCSQHSGEITKVVLQNLSAEQIYEKINDTRRQHKLTNSRNNVQRISLLNKDVIGPKNFNDTFKKVIRDVKSSSSSETPNLSVLRIKSVPNIKPVNSNGKSVNSLKENKNSDDIRDLFGNNEDLDEFFNDDLVFCSTQKQTFDSEKVGETINKCAETKMETCSADNQERSRIFEDVLDGFDASALFDEF